MIVVCWCWLLMLLVVACCALLLAVRCVLSVVDCGLLLLCIVV